MKYLVGGKGGGGKGEGGKGGFDSLSSSPGYSLDSNIYVRLSEINLPKQLIYTIPAEY